MAIIKSAMLTIRLSSSYVLIITTPSAGFSERVGARPPATRLNTLFFCGCPGGSGSAGVGFLIILIDFFLKMWNTIITGGGYSVIQKAVVIKLQ